MLRPLMAALLDPALIARLMETWVRRPRAPTRLVMDLTRRCNLRCEMCHTWKVEPAHELSPDEVRAALAQMPELLWLDLTGGEIFLRADAAELFDAVLDAAKSLKVLHFPTNGWFTRRALEVTRRVRARRPDLALIVTVSVDGPEALHDRIRGREGSFRRAMETYRALCEVPGADVYLGTTVTPSNRDHLDALQAALAAELPGFHPRRWHWNWLQVSQHFFANAHLAEAAGERAAPGALVHEHLERRGAPTSMVELMELMFLVNLDAYRRGERAGIPCQALRSAAFISPEGVVYPCHVWDRPVGDLRAQTLDEIWNAPETLKIREDITERLACGGCFTPCEAYPALAGAPLHTLAQTARRGLTMLRARRRAGGI
ncbi:MAG: radical SAM protein [Polyangiales bacterium]